VGYMRKSQHKQGSLIEYFVAGTTARTPASLCGVHRNTAAYYFVRLREINAYELEANSEAMFGVDESYFGGKRKSKRGRDAVGKIPILGLFKRGGQVYTRCFRRHADPYHRVQGGPASR
jgi:transposase